jgi:NAD(P)-dependent dehydrogenase (short-subunit alcohol dehydrogenase family)
MKSDPGANARTVLVTGGSRGIGAAASRLAAGAGWAVAVNYTRDRAAAEAVVAAIVRGGGRALALRADVAVHAEVRAMFAAIDAALPPLAGLVNNAGVVTPRVDAMTSSGQRMFAINVFGSFYCAREAIARMTISPRAPARAAHAGGAIVNVSSAAAKLGGGSQYVDYAAARGAVETFTIVARKSPRGHSRRRGAPRDHRHRHPHPGGAPDRAPAGAARPCNARHQRRSRRSDRLAPLRPRQLHHRLDPGSHRRSLTAA